MKFRLILVLKWLRCKFGVSDTDSRKSCVFRFDYWWRTRNFVMRLQIIWNVTLSWPVDIVTNVSKITVPSSSVLSSQNVFATRPNIRTWIDTNTTLKTSSLSRVFSFPCCRYHDLQPDIVQDCVNTYRLEQGPVVSWRPLGVWLCRKLDRVQFHKLPFKDLYWSVLWLARTRCRMQNVSYWYCGMLKP